MTVMTLLSGLTSGRLSCLTIMIIRYIVNIESKYTPCGVQGQFRDGRRYKYKCRWLRKGREEMIESLNSLSFSHFV